MYGCLNVSCSLLCTDLPPSAQDQMAVVSAPPPPPPPPPRTTEHTVVWYNNKKELSNKGIIVFKTDPAQNHDAIWVTLLDSLSLKPSGDALERWHGVSGWEAPGTMATG